MNNATRYAIVTLMLGMMFGSGFRVASATYLHFFPEKSEVWVCIQDSAKPLETCTELLKMKAHGQKEDKQ